MARPYAIWEWLRSCAYFCASSSHSGGHLKSCLGSPDSYSKTDHPPTGGQICCWAGRVDGRQSGQWLVWAMRGIGVPPRTAPHRRQAVCPRESWGLPTLYEPTPIIGGGPICPILGPRGRFTCSRLSSRHGRPFRMGSTYRTGRIVR